MKKPTKKELKEWSDEEDQKLDTWKELQNKQVKVIYKDSFSDQLKRSKASFKFVDVLRYIKKQKEKEKNE